MTNLIVKVYDSIEAQYEIRNLKKNGYKRIENCFWSEIWEKDGWKVELRREF